MKDVYALRQKDETGLTIRERDVLRYRAKGLNWSEIARVLSVSRNRVKEVKQNLTLKGMLTEDGELSETGKDVLDG